MNEQEIRDLFNKVNVPLDRDDVWKVQSALVVKHKALERLAGSLGIAFKPPTVIRAERDEAVILATGILKDREEWSIGECLATDGTTPGNYRISGKQAPYVWAMAEKRAKDRVILKLAGLHGAYSEDEADDFKEQPQAPSPTRKGTYDALEALITETESMEQLSSVLKSHDQAIHSLPEDMQADLRKVYAVKREALRVFA